MSKRRASMLRLSAANDILNLTDFLLFITHAQSNSIFDPLCNRAVMTPTTQPLSQFYVLTSVHSAVDYSAPSGRPEVSTTAVKRVLMLGARCVHFAVFDGPTSAAGAVVAADASKRSTVSFREAMLALKEFAFHPTNPQPTSHPVIVRITNHCSPAFQEQAAKVLQEVLGGRLVTSLPGGYLGGVPAPRQLQRKFILHVDGFEMPKLALADGSDGAGADADADADADAGASSDDGPLSPALRKLVALHYTPPERLPSSGPGFLTVVDADAVQAADGAAAAPGVSVYDRNYVVASHSSTTTNPDPHVLWSRGVSAASMQFTLHDVPLWRSLGRFRTNGGAGCVPQQCGVVCLPAPPSKTVTVVRDCVSCGVDLSPSQEHRWLPQAQEPGQGKVRVVTCCHPLHALPSHLTPHP